jgi:hypothetical protein
MEWVALAFSLLLAFTADKANFLYLVDVAFAFAFVIALAFAWLLVLPSPFATAPATEAATGHDFGNFWGRSGAFRVPSGLL